MDAENLDMALLVADHGQGQSVEIAVSLATLTLLLVLMLAFTAGPAAWLEKTGRPCLAVMWLVLSVVAVTVVFEFA